MDWKALSLLVERAQRDDDTAFSEIYRITSPYVFSQARKILKNESDIEDVVQEVYLQVAKSIKGLINPMAFGSWLMRIVAQKCLRRLEKVKIDNINTDALNSDIEDKSIIAPIDVVLHNESKEFLTGLIENLTDVQRDTIMLYYYDGLKVREIAVIMNCSENTVKSRLYQAKRKIFAELEGFPTEF